MVLIFNIILYYLISMLIVSSIPKVFNLKEFIKLVKEYDFLSKNASIVYGAVIPFVELFSSFLLLFNEIQWLGSLLVILTFSSFLIGISYVLKSGKKLMCGCYGKLLDTEISKFSFYKLIILIALSTIIFFGSFQHEILFNYSVAIIGTTLMVTSLLMEKVWATVRNNIQQINS